MDKAERERSAERAEKVVRTFADMDATDVVGDVSAYRSFLARMALLFAREDIPALLAEVERLEKERDEAIRQRDEVVRLWNPQSV